MYQDIASNNGYGLTSKRRPTMVTVDYSQGFEEGRKLGYYSGYTGGFSVGYRDVAGLVPPGLDVVRNAINDLSYPSPDEDSYTLGYRQGYRRVYDDAYDDGVEDGTSYYLDLYANDGDDLVLDSDHYALNKESFARGFNDGLVEARGDENYDYDISEDYPDGRLDHSSTVDDISYSRGIEYGVINAHDIDCDGLLNDPY